MTVYTLPRAGIDTYVLFGEETTYGTAASTINKHFGIVQSVSPSAKRNLVQIRGFTGSTTSGRNMIKALGGKFEVSLTVEFQPQHFDWFKYVIGTRTGAGTSASKYVYSEKITGTTTSTSAGKLVDSAGTFDSTLTNQRVINTTDNTTSTITAVDSGIQLTVKDDIFTTGEAYTILADGLTSITVATNQEMGDTDRVWKYLGLKVNTCTIKTTMGEPVSVTLDLIGADVDQSAAKLSPVALDTSDPYHFASSAIEIPNATSISNIIDSIEITIGNSVEVLYGLGSYVGKAGISKAREYSIKLSMKTLDNNQSTYFLGGATDVTTPTEIATLEVNMAGSTNHTAAFLFSNVTVEDWNVGENYGDPLGEDITYIAESLTVTEQQTA